MLGSGGIKTELIWGLTTEEVDFFQQKSVQQAQIFQEGWRAHVRNDVRGLNRIVAMSYFSKLFEGAFHNWYEGLNQN